MQIDPMRPSLHALSDAHGTPNYLNLLTWLAFGYGGVCQQCEHSYRSYCNLYTSCVVHCRMMLDGHVGLRATRTGCRCPVVASASPVDLCLKRGEVSGGPEPTFVILTIGTSAECLNSCSIEPDRSRSFALTCPRTVSCTRKLPRKI